MTSMSETVLFGRAPITEAVIEIQVALPPDIHLGRLAQIHDSVKDRYPSLKDRTLMSGGVQFRGASEAPVVTHSAKQQGFLMTSGEGTQVLQVLQDRFAFSRLAPYTKWEHVRAEALGLWGVYRTFARPVKVVRLALRYINRIELPLPVDEMAEFLSTRPEVSSRVMDGIDSFFMQVTGTDAPTGAKIVINETIDPNNTKEGILPVILDIDVFQPVDLTPESPEVWSCLDRLRDVKNRVFAESLAKRAKELVR